MKECLHTEGRPLLTTGEGVWWRCEDCRKYLLVSDGWIIWIRPSTLARQEAA